MVATEGEADSSPQEPLTFLNRKTRASHMKVSPSTKLHFFAHTTFKTNNSTLMLFKRLTHRTISSLRWDPGLHLVVKVRSSTCSLIPFRRMRLESCWIVSAPKISKSIKRMDPRMKHSYFTLHLKVVRIPKSSKISFTTETSTKARESTVTFLCTCWRQVSC